MARLAVLEPGKQAASFRVEFVRDWTKASARWGNGGDATVFQHRHWLDAWYRAFDTVNPVIAIISDTSTQRDVALVPLVFRNQHGVRSVEFADLGLSDYNAPILASNAQYVAASLRTIGSALLAALRQLPDRPDLIRLKKMPLEICGRPNPLAEIEGARSCSMNGNLVELGDDFEVYRASIRKIQMPRCWRVFTRHHPGARFEIVTTVDEALRILDVMDRQQHKRMKQLGENFVLDEPRRAKFYRDVVSRGLAEGYAVVSALICDDGVVATTLGLRHGRHYSLLRNTYGEQWSNFSPSRLCIERTMAALHGQGVRHFDFSIGNYDYKRRFGAEPLPLTDVGIALSWRGTPHVLRDQAVERLRRYPRLAGKVRRAAGSVAAVKKLWAR
ncbi:CelD/BcsL family acetyltransferase involved in cellulose biosynthesis [Bradyrhizobium sp. AZCC 1610]|uniref:GNAT family N-acetyltransferase n=1 Tax=Bradyrhizobium sp. AZCC 1610 TaxID=3117020 RepID=UPI002FF3D66E